MWSAEQGKLIFPCPRSRLRIWSRETGSAVPSRVSLFISILKLNLVLTYGIPPEFQTGSAVPSRVSLLISILKLNLVLTYGIPPEFRGGVHLFILNRHTPSGQSRVCRITQLRTDGVHCRDYASTGPVNIKVVPNECCLGRSPRTN